MTKLSLSAVGHKMHHRTGVRAIMADIKRTLLQGTKIINLSAGNPVVMPAVTEMWAKYNREVLDSSEYGNIVGQYGSSQGYEPFIEAVVAWFNARYQWGITNENVLVTPGSQMLYFIAANTFGGYTKDGILKQIVLPICPEYTGYGGVVLDQRMLKAFAPVVTVKSEHTFKYHINPKAEFIDDLSGAVMFSRPSNPSGNILTDQEVRLIVSQADAQGVPVFIDSAYAPPFPSLAYGEYENMTPMFGGNIVHCMSLSKAGMPGERIGIAIGAPEYIAAMEAFQSNSNLHASRLGQAIAARALMSNELVNISRTVIRPFYQQNLDYVQAELKNKLGDLPWSMHQGEGGLFSWVWFKDLPITDLQLYEELKDEGVIVVPGSTFFPGFDEDWPHKEQCIRISLTASREDIEQGVDILARIMHQVYDNVPVRHQRKK